MPGLEQGLPSDLRKTRDEEGLRGMSWTIKGGHFMPKVNQLRENGDRRDGLFQEGGASRRLRSWTGRSGTEKPFAEGPRGMSESPCAG